MAYGVEVGAKARAQLDGLDPIVGFAVERKIIWLAQNAAAMIHRRLVGMPDDLRGPGYGVGGRTTDNRKNGGANQ